MRNYPLYFFPSGKRWFELVRRSWTTPELMWNYPVGLVPTVDLWFEQVQKDWTTVKLSVGLVPSVKSVQSLKNLLKPQFDSGIQTYRIVWHEFGVVQPNWTYSNHSLTAGKYLTHWVRCGSILLEPQFACVRGGSSLPNFFELQHNLCKLLCVSVSHVFEVVWAFSTTLINGKTEVNSFVGMFNMCSMWFESSEFLWTTAHRR